MLFLYIQSSSPILQIKKYLSSIPTYIAVSDSTNQHLQNSNMVFIRSVPRPVSSLLLFVFILAIILCSSGVRSLGINDDYDSVYSQCLKVPVSEFMGSVKSTIDAVQEVTSVVSQFGDFFGDFRLSNAISDCLDLLDFSSEELGWTLDASQNSNQAGGKGGKGKGTGNLSSDLRTWLSGALVNQDTCIDGFDGTNSFIKPIIVGGLTQISSLVLHILAQVHETIPGGKTTPATAAGERKLAGNDQFPQWLSGRDRRKLLQSNGLSADVVVATDGSGDFDKIADAVATAPSLSTQRFVIYVKKGVYNEYVEISKKKWNIMMIGDGMDSTIISGNRSFIGGWTTYRSATFAVKGRGFIARDITFENTAGPDMHQAVAFRSDSDLSVLFRCGMSGYQDTLYAHSMRQFYRECRISGTVDFIFGDGTVVFQSCEILARKGLPNQKNTITAQGRKDPTEPTGFSIQFSNITAEPELLAAMSNTQTYLGRPWKLYSRTMIMQSYISQAIRAEGWLEWNGDFALDTLWYGEFMNYGPSAGLGGRVTWPGFHGLNDSSQASNFTVAQFILGNSWLPSTGVKYTAGFAV